MIQLIQMWRREDIIWVICDNSHVQQCYKPFTVWYAHAQCTCKVMWSAFLDYFWYGTKALVWTEIVFVLKWQGISVDMALEADRAFQIFNLQTPFIWSFQ